jgi:glycosyltransferase involved in cell wall biosynthesis
MRVLMVNWIYKPEFSGAALQCHRLSLQLQKMNIELESLAGTDRTEFVGSGMVDSISIYRVLRNKSTFYNHMGYGWDIFQYIVKNAKRYDVLHSHGFIAPVNLAAKATGLPLIQKITDFNLDDPAAVHRRHSGRVAIPIYEMADVVIPTSKLLEDTCRIGLTGKNRIVRIPNGVDTSVFRPASFEEKMDLRSKLGVSPDHMVLLTVGTVSYKKGMDTLIKALYLLKKQHSGPIVLWIVGPEQASAGFNKNDMAVDKFAHLVRTMVENYGLENIVIFKGEQPNIHEYMQAADIYVHPSKQEGQPNSILEAMSCGLPVVANLIPGITDEIIQTGKFGYLINCEETDVFSAALRVLIHNPSLCKRLGNNAREEILQHYDICYIADRYCELYEQLVYEKGQLDMLMAKSASLAK